MIGLKRVPAEIQRCRHAQVCWVSILPVAKAKTWISIYPFILKIWALPKPLLVPPRQPNRLMPEGANAVNTGNRKPANTFGNKSIHWLFLLATTAHHAENWFKEELWCGTLIDLIDVDLDSHKCWTKEAESSALPRLPTLPKNFSMAHCSAERLSKH